MSTNKPMATSPIPPQRMPAQNPGQTGWMQPPATSPAFNNSPRPGPPGVRMSNQQGPQISTPQLPPQIAPSQQNQQLQRQVNTPLQILGPGAGQPSQNGAQNQLANNGMGVVNRQPGQITMNQVLQPLSPEAFHKAFHEQWLPKHPPKDRSILRFEGRDIDLYRLHCEVMSMGSVKLVGRPLSLCERSTHATFCAQVSQRDLWPAIGAKMGWVHFPGNESEPSRAGPALALHLEQIYKEFLHDFDAAYIRQLMIHRRQTYIQQAQQAQKAAENRGQLPQVLTDIKDPKLLQELPLMANLSVHEMSQRGLAPTLIQLVERNREQLKGMLESQNNFSKNIQLAQQGGGPAQQRNVSSPMGPVAHQQPQVMNGGMSSAMAGAQQDSMNMANGARMGMPSQAQQQHPQQHPMAGGLVANATANGQPPQAPMGAPQQRGAAVPNRPTPQQVQMAAEMVKRLREENRGESLALAMSARVHFVDGFP